ncbi:hypothetical protein JL722_3686 [Aureococcus anophagefferens]|nr:hypothetical protein JL722_3686 [Aureococcus anophagefferens]
MAPNYVRVGVRIRPPFEDEIADELAEEPGGGGWRPAVSVVEAREGQAVVRLELGKKRAREFAYDYAFGPEASQADVFDAVAAPVVDAVAAGARTARFLQIYNDTIHDLLAPARRRATATDQPSTRRRGGRGAPRRAADPSRAAPRARGPGGAAKRTGPRLLVEGRREYVVRAGARRRSDVRAAPAAARRLWGRAGRAPPPQALGNVIAALCGDAAAGGGCRRAARAAPAPAARAPASALAAAAERPARQLRHASALHPDARVAPLPWSGAAAGPAASPPPPRRPAAPRREEEEGEADSAYSQLDAESAYSELDDDYSQLG